MPGGPRFAVTFLHDGPIAELQSWWREAEQARFAWIGVPDTQLVARELWVTATVAAYTTSSVPIVACVTNPVTRHPSVTASAALALEELFPGRVWLGLGTGNSATAGVGLPPASVEQLRGYIRAVRNLLNGQPAEWAGERFTPAWSTLGAARQIPIYVGCSGPRVTRMAAAEADGLFVSLGYTPAQIAYAKELISDGCRESSRDESELDTWWIADIQLGATAEDLEQAGLHFSPTLGRIRDPRLVPPHLQPALAELARMWTLPTHASQRPEWALRAEQLGVLEWLRERSGMFWGSPVDVRRRLEELAGQGLTQWALLERRKGSQTRAWLESMRSEILTPHFSFRSKF